jgi:hypothetical protein
VELFPGNVASPIQRPDQNEGRTFTEHFCQGPFPEEREKNLFFPWEDEDEWDFSHKFLRMGGSLAEKTELLKTRKVMTVSLLLALS